MALQIESPAALRAHYAAVRKRLRNPSLKITKIEAVPSPVEDTPTEIIDIPSFLPPRNSEDVAFTGPHSPTATGIAAVVCAFYNLKKSEFVSQRREMRVTRPRQIAMYLAREHTTSSLPQIGRLYGGRDHSTVLSAIARVRSLIAADPKIASDVQEIEKQILGGSRVS